MFHSPATHSISQPGFVTRILIKPFAQGLRIVPLMRRLLSLLGFALFSASIYGQAINCPVGTGFNNSGGGVACGVSLVGYNDNKEVFIAKSVNPVLSGTALNLIPTGSNHIAAGLTYQTAVNVQAFTATMTFVPNGNNVAFVLQNNSAGSPCPGAGCQIFVAGASGEAGCFQGADGPSNVPNNIICIAMDSGQPLTDGGSFTYSSVLLTQTFQSTGASSLPGYIPEYSTTRFSTSPVSLTQPGAALTCFQTVGGTCDTFSTTFTYDGSTLTQTMFDVTAGGSCPGASCFTQTWTNISIPSLVGSHTAYLSITGGTGLASTIPLLINSLVYTVNSPTATPSFTAYNANSTYNTGSVSAASPVYSIAPGTYSGSQSVSITTSSAIHSYICYELSAGTPALYPQTDNNGGCTVGTLYSGPVSIASTATLYAMASTNNTSFGSGVNNPTGLGPPSTLVAGTYTIGSLKPAPPTLLGAQVH
jgi:hypothetical protein